MPEVAKPRKVQFTAIGLDGKPMRKIYIQLEDLRFPGEASSYVNVDLDENGAGELTVYSGYSYHLHGSHWVSYGNDWCSKAVVIAPGTVPVKAKFVMYRKDVSCEISETDRARRSLTLVTLETAQFGAERFEFPTWLPKFSCHLIKNEKPSNKYSCFPSLETGFTSPRRTCCIAVTTLRR